VVPALGARVRSSAATAAGAVTNDVAKSAAPAPNARPLRVMFLDMFLFLSWFTYSHLAAGRKSEIPPTKQEIAHPYGSRVTDNMSGHYALYGDF